VSDARAISPHLCGFSLSLNRQMSVISHASLNDRYSDWQIAGTREQADALILQIRLRTKLLRDFKFFSRDSFGA